MSVSDLGPHEQEFERTPPHDIAAEQGVLGGMLLSQDAIAEVIEVLRTSDFYRPAHQIIYDVVLDLYGRGDPADAVTVSGELTKNGEINRIGGAPYLHTLISSVPTAANAGYYAKIVHERAVLRRLVETGTRIVQMGYAADGADADEVLDRAQAEVFAIAEKRAGEDYVPLSEIMPGALDEIEAIGSRGGQMVGTPTGFADLDSLTNGLHPGQMIVVAARPAMGKAVKLDTPLPTPSGWTTMGEVRVGDHLIGADGRPTRVTAATEVMHDRPCYEVEFSDGEVIVADAEHQWRTTARAARRSDRRAALAGAGGGRAFGGESEPAPAPSARTRTTTEILATLRHDGAPNHAVEVADPFDLPPVDLPVDPYLLGLRLGSGRASHLPNACLRASAGQRRALLDGLLDTAANPLGDGRVLLDVASGHLAHAVHELLASLGRRATVEPVTADGRPDGAAPHRITVTAARERYIVDVRRVPSVPVRCVQVDNDDHMYLAGRSCIPTHNSTLALDFARAASIKHGLTSAFFSLEMGRNEITMRLLSAEARVALHAMRSGTMQDEDWTRLARRMSEVAEAPLFIDDSPNMSMMEIRAKCRRLKQQHDLRLVIIDYLQLMTSGKRVESRQVEVSEFSRSLKLLAKELGVPVIALSQLNRGPEQRTDKKPMVSDLRESGCVTASTRIMRADTNEEVAIGDLVASGERDVPVWALDERLKYVPRTMTHAFPSGRKEVFRVRMASGKQVEATANHPFLTYGGWTALGDLTVGSRVAAARHVPPPQEPSAWPQERIVLLAHLIGDGSFVKGQPIRYASKDEACLQAVAAAARHFGVTAARDEYEAARVTTLRLRSPHRLTHGRRNPIAEWLDELGLFGLRSHEKFVPAPVFGLPKEQVALFLGHLWATDGCVHWDAERRQCRVYYASTSRRLVDDVSRLLLRFGILSRVKTVTKASYRPGYQLHIYGSENQLAFFSAVEVLGARGVVAAAAAGELHGLKANTNVDTVPREVWDDVKKILVDQGMTHREFSAAIGTEFCGSALWKRAPSRERLGRVATALGSAELDLLCTNDVFWDEIVEIESIGEQVVYDATVMGLHNFIANGLALHNSIEQDADMVILLHREDAYEKESPRAGEADLIVAKHRNGPTATVTVAFQGHYSRFVDMAQ